MKNRTIIAVMFLTAAAISLPGCEQAVPADEAHMEQPAATIAAAAIPDAIIDESWEEWIIPPTDEPEESLAPAQSQSAQETSPPTNVIEPVAAYTAKPAETKSAAATEAPAPVTATPKPTAEPSPVVIADAAPTTTPRPTATPRPTTTPTPKPTLAPKHTSTPAPFDSPKPTASPVPTPVPTATPHVHSWTIHEATGHFEAQKTGTEEVVVGTYWEEIGGLDEDRAAYYKCNDCGAEFFSNLDAGDHILSAYHSSYSYYPAETIHHNGEWIVQTRYETRDLYEDVWIVDSEAYWTCACGETRYSQP